MTNEQLYLAIGVPIVFNTILIGLLASFQNRQLDIFKEGLYKYLDAKFERTKEHI